jgi:hypothetical protein
MDRDCRDYADAGAVTEAVCSDGLDRDHAGHRCSILHCGDRSFSGCPAVRDLARHRAQHRPAEWVAMLDASPPTACMTRYRRSSSAAKYRQFDASRTLPSHADCARGRPRKIDDTAGDKGSAIIDAYSSERPFPKCATRTRVPNGRDLCAAVRAWALNRPPEASRCGSE